MAFPSLVTLISGLKAGDVSMLARAITLIESRNPKHQEQAAELIDAVLPVTGNSVRLGITGVPGVGKSSFIETFGLHLIEEHGKKVAVLAIDPSSVLSKGSILGDKTRMERLSVHPRAFIRPSASGGHLGGLTYKTQEAILLCEAAGYDYILVETVGVGQSEVEVGQITDCFLLLMLAGAGDELQGIKKGIMEMADSVVIHKADGDNIQKAKTARSEFARALHFFPPQASGWRPKVVTASALTGAGVAEVSKLVSEFTEWQKAKGFWESRRRQQALLAFERLLNAKFVQLVSENPAVEDKIKTLKAAISRQQLSPYSAVKQLFEGFSIAFG